jgi:hypothetical protein
MPSSHPWDEPPNALASRIADKFYPVTSLQHAELRREIEYRIECEREVAYHYLMQMGRWVDKAREQGVLR